MRAQLALLIAAVLPCTFAACGSSGGDDSAPASPAPSSTSSNQPFEPGPYQPPPASALVEDGAVKIRREVMVIDGVAAPDNPAATQAASTPADYQKVRVVRYRMEAPTPLPARAIAVMMPGFLGGAGSFDEVARAIVRRSTAEAPLEAWAIDRRSNLLEDHHGLDVAEHFRDPGKASAYYLDGEPVEGKSFGGFLPQGQAGFVSEWGLATTIGDLRAVISLLPQAERKARVTLIGHSLGASIVEAYAAWDFDGTAGFSELASLVLVDGVAGSEGAAEVPRTQELYEKGGDPAPGGFGMTPGLEAVRKSSRYFTLPILGSKVYPVASIIGMRALWSPDDVVDDQDRDNLMSTLLSLGKLPKMTNRAAMGLSFDASTNALSFAAVNCGEASGGPMTPYTSAFGPMLVHPGDPEATYGWTSYDQVSPRENTSVDTLARAWFEGPGLDFSEWYFPQRLTIDAPLASTLTLAPTDWPAASYGIRAFHGKEMDLPIFAHAAGLLSGDVGQFDKLRSLVSMVPVGSGRPASGEPRSSERAFKALGSPSLSHIDPLLGADDKGSAVGSWYDALAAWMVDNAAPGGVAVPAAKLASRAAPRRGRPGGGEQARVFEHQQREDRVVGHLGGVVGGEPQQRSLGGVGVAGHGALRRGVGAARERLEQGRGRAGVRGHQAAELGAPGRELGQPQRAGRGRGGVGRVGLGSRGRRLHHRGADPGVSYEQHVIGPEGLVALDRPLVLEGALGRAHRPDPGGVAVDADLAPPLGQRVVGQRQIAGGNRADEDGGLNEDQPPALAPYDLEAQGEHGVDISSPGPAHTGHDRALSLVVAFALRCAAMFERSRVGLSTLLAAATTLLHVAPALGQTPPPPPPAPPSTAGGATAPAPPATAGGAGSPAAPPVVTTPGMTPPVPGAVPPASSGQPAGPSAPPAPPGWPTVTFAPTNPSAVLERWEFSPTEGRSAWRTVCVGTCTQPMDNRFGYRVSGAGVVSSAWFKLPASAQPLQLKANVGSSGMRTAGIVTSLVGVAVATAGFIVIVPSKDEQNQGSSFSGKAVTGGILAGAGVLTLFVGLALVGTSGTSLTVDAAPAGGAPSARLNLPGGLSLSPAGLQFLELFPARAGLSIGRRLRYRRLTPGRAACPGESRRAQRRHPRFEPFVR